MKKIFCLILTIIVFLAMPVSLLAEENSSEIEISGADEIKVPNDANEFMQEHNISISEPSGAIEITPKDVFLYIWNSFKDKLSAPIRLLGMLLAVVLLASLIEGLGDNPQNEGMSKIYNMISILVCVGVISGEIFNSIRLTTETIGTGSDFMASYIPIFSSIIAASGSITSAGSYSVILLAATEVFAQIAKNFLTPLLGLMLALSVVEAINPTISLTGLTNCLKKITTVGLGLVMTVFVGLLTIQSIIGTSVDTVAVKAGKFVVSSFVPVVGSAISDAYTAIKGSLGVLRGGVGIFGIIALFLTTVPSIISVIAVQAAVYIAGLAAEIFNIKQLNSFLKNTSSILSIAVSILICFTLMLIISTTIVMMVAMNME
ncbi:MAG: hypothetical protein RR540_06260 [Oscillospiraceae bacterium]